MSSKIALVAAVVSVLLDSIGADGAFARILLAPSGNENPIGNAKQHQLLRQSFESDLARSKAGARLGYGRVVKFTIKYVAPRAEKVYILWGLNGWQTPDPFLWPKGCGQKIGFPYCRMTKTDDAFSITLRIPEGATLDYCFNLQVPSKNVDVWDTNTAPYRDYHSVVTAGGDALIIPQPGTMPGTELPVMKQIPWSSRRLLLCGTVGVFVGIVGGIVGRLLKQRRVVHLHGGSPSDTISQKTYRTK